MYEVKIDNFRITQSFGEICEVNTAGIWSILAWQQKENLPLC